MAFIRLYTASIAASDVIEASRGIGQVEKMSFELYISDNVGPGEYPWPVRLNIIL